MTALTAPAVLQLAPAPPARPRDSSSCPVQRRSSLLSRRETVQPAGESRAESADRAVVLNIARSYVGKVRQYQTAAQIAEAFRHDRDLLCLALREHTEAWRLLLVAAPRLRQDRDLMQLALSHPSGQGWRALATPYAPLELRSDREIGMEAIHLSSGIALQYLAPELRHDAEFITEALKAQADEAGDWKVTAASPQGPSWQSLLEHCRHVSSGRTSRKLSRQQTRNQQTPRRQLNAREAGGVELMRTLENDATFAQKNQARRGSTQMVGQWVEQQTGETVRIVPVVAIQLQRSDGLVFVQIGKVQNGIPKPECFLPGGKILANEMPGDARERIITEFLAPIRDGMLIGETEFLYDQRISDSTGVPSRYLRLITKASLQEDFEIAPRLQKVRVSKANLNTRGGVPRPRAPRGHSGLAQRYNAKQGSHAPDIFAMVGDPNRAKGLVLLYAWLPLWEFERLRTGTDAKATISVWLGDLDLGAFVSESWSTGIRTGSVAAPGLAVRHLRKAVMTAPKTESDQEVSEEEDDDDEREDEEKDEEENKEENVDEDEEENGKSKEEEERGEESREEDRREEQQEDQEEQEQEEEQEDEEEEEAEKMDEAARSSGSLETVLREALQGCPLGSDGGFSDGGSSSRGNGGGDGTER